MLLRDRLAARIAEMGGTPDYQRLAADVLGIRNAPAALARRLVAQAMVIEDREQSWRKVGEEACDRAPAAPGVYVLLEKGGRALYVGKAVNVRRRLRAHFAGRTWRRVKPELARVADAEWTEVGSELEALLREAALIRELQPSVNVQVGQPRASGRAVPSHLTRDTLVLERSIEADSAELIGVKADGGWMIQRTRRDGSDLAVHAKWLWRFFRVPSGDGAGRLAPIAFSWLAGRGRAATRLDPNDAPTARVLRLRLASLLADEALFTERIVVR